MKPIDILPVEDHVGEIHITTEVLREDNLFNELNVVRADLINFIKSEYIPKGFLDFHCSTSKK